MSYRPSVKDSSRATPYFYQRRVPPVKTHRTTYFDIAQSALVTRKLGNYKPFWAKSLDYAHKGYKKYKKVTKKFPFLKKRYLLPNTMTWHGPSSKRFNPKQDLSSRPSRSKRNCRPTTIYFRNRYGQRFARTIFCNGYSRTHRVKN